MRILLSDGSGLTSRQVATQAAAAGHVVEAVAPTWLGPASFTRHVRRVHRVPAFGRNPERWLEATLEVLRTGGHDVLLGTHEQVALLSRDAARVSQLGVALAVPPFASLLRVQDKVAQATTLREVGLPHPPTWVATSREELLARAAPPVYLKAPIGTASNAVRLASDRVGLLHAASDLELADGVVVQDSVPGSLVMIQAVFDHGELLAWHANLREREGSSGGASAKRSVALPVVGNHLESLGGALQWHGALSLDAILTPDGPRYIDVNPRLVEPANAWRAGVDLVSVLLDVSTGKHVNPLTPGRAGVRTHQLLLALLGAAQHGGGRRGIARELATALTHRGPYAGSIEELTPLRGDPLAAIPVAAAALATLAHPASWRLFTDGAVSAYALTPTAWKQIVRNPVACRQTAADSRR
jgi:predicted ATP-grasp superfamily ATP-dependent carboligase